MGRVIAHPSDIGLAQLADCGSYDISEMYYAQSGKKFYINMPQKYFISVLTRYSLANLLLALVSYRYWFPFLTPMYWILYFKLNIFFSWCGVMNFSKKKLWLFMIAETILLQIICVFVRSYLMSIWYMR